MHPDTKVFWGRGSIDIKRSGDEIIVSLRVEPEFEERAFHFLRSDIEAAPYGSLEGAALTRIWFQPETDTTVPKIHLAFGSRRFLLQNPGAFRDQMEAGVRRALAEVAQEFNADKTAATNWLRTLNGG